MHCGEGVGRGRGGRCSDGMGQVWWSLEGAGEREFEGGEGEGQFEEVVGSGREELGGWVGIVIERRG